MTSMTLDNLKEMSNKNPTVFATSEFLITFTLIFVHQFFCSSTAGLKQSN